MDTRKIRLQLDEICSHMNAMDARTQPHTDTKLLAQAVFRLSDIAQELAEEVERLEGEID
jgi:methyl-accepting chemotaxis protein